MTVINNGIIPYANKLEYLQTKRLNNLKLALPKIMPSIY